VREALRGMHDMTAKHLPACSTLAEACDPSRSAERTTKPPDSMISWARLHQGRCCRRLEKLPLACLPCTARPTHPPTPTGCLPAGL
jgi:hypothetical protein